MPVDDLPVTLDEAAESPGRSASRRTAPDASYREPFPDVWVIDDFVDNPQGIAASVLATDPDWIRTDPQLHGQLREVLNIDHASEPGDLWASARRDMEELARDYSRITQIPYAFARIPQFERLRDGLGFTSGLHDDSPVSPTAFAMTLFLSVPAQGGSRCYTKAGISISPVPGRLIVQPGTYVLAKWDEVPQGSDRLAMTISFARPFDDVK